MGMSEPDIRGVKTAALLHDIGNLAVPEHILSKPGRLTYDEYERLKLHPRVGAEIIRSVPFPYPVAPLVLSHHERWDGRGYPVGLKGQDIPLGARIIAVVDCFTSMLTDRPYRPPRTYAEAIATLRENGGVDPGSRRSSSGSSRCCPPSSRGCTARSRSHRPSRPASGTCRRTSRSRRWPTSPSPTVRSRCCATSRTPSVRRCGCPTRCR